jgi:hypothetical protein
MRGFLSWPKKKKKGKMSKEKSHEERKKTPQL